jgi:hypothetical protein
MPFLNLWSQFTIDRLAQIRCSANKFRTIHDQAKGEQICLAT